MQGMRSVWAERLESSVGSSRTVPTGWSDNAFSTPSSHELSELALGRLIHDGAFSPRPIAAQSRALSLLLTLRTEVTRAAVLTAICATAANALRDEPDLRAARALTRFYPVGSSDFILASTRYCRLDPATAAAEALNAFNDALGCAMSATVQFTADRQAIPNLAAVPTVDLCAAWQTACTKAHRVLAEIENAIRIFNPVRRVDDDDVLVAALKEAAAGRAPLREPDGEFVMPHWVEQRQSPRITVSCAALLVIGTIESAIRITDVSTGGLGIETFEQLSDGDIVAIDLGGILLPGRVIWRRRGRAGIVFEQNLLDDSPEYRFLASHEEAR